MIQYFKISQSLANDHYRSVTVEEINMIQAKTVKNSNKYNSTSRKTTSAATNTRSVYEDGGSTSKNACMISDGGKIISKCNSNTFYHVNNNRENRQKQHQQQQYIKPAPLRNSPIKTKFSTLHCSNISNSSDEDHSRHHSSVRFLNENIDLDKNDSVETCSLDSNNEIEVSEQQKCGRINPSPNTYYGKSKTIRKRGVSCEGFEKTSSYYIPVHQINNRRSLSVGVFCDSNRENNLNREHHRKDTGYVTILKINDTSETNARKDVKLSITKAGDYHSSRPTKSNSSYNVNVDENQAKTVPRKDKQSLDTHKKIATVSTNKESETEIKKNGSVLVKVKDTPIKRINKVDLKSNNSFSSVKDNSSHSSSNEHELHLKSNLGIKPYQLNSKTGDGPKEIKRVQSNLSKPTKSSSLKRHSSICSGDLNVNRSKTVVPNFSADRRLSVDKAIQCRAASSSSFKFRSLVSNIDFIFILIFNNLQPKFKFFY